MPTRSRRPVLTPSETRRWGWSLSLEGSSIFVPLSQSFKQWKQHVCNPLCQKLRLIQTLNFYSWFWMMTKKAECLSSPTHLPSIYEGQPITSKVAWKAREKHDTLLTGLLLIWVEGCWILPVELFWDDCYVDTLLLLMRLIQQKSVWAPPSGCGWVCTSIQAGCQQHHLLVGADSCEVRAAAHWCVCVSGSDEGPGRKCKVLWVHSWDLPSCPGSGLKLQGRGRCWRLPPPAHLSCWLVISLWSCGGAGLLQQHLESLTFTASVTHKFYQEAWDESVSYCNIRWMTVSVLRSIRIFFIVFL